jgi:UDP-GlcNAc:undecaprenyl-phosphate/decaprenyl-phosphate GlcNAc-1-phosphate transferase
MYQSELLHLILALGLGFIITIVILPPILKVAREKHLFDPPCARKLHTRLIPPLGGIAIFIAFILSTIFSSYGTDFYPLRYLIASLLLLFFIGLKDDLITVSARKKFVVQVIAALVIILLGKGQLTNLHGVFGIYAIPPVVGIPLTLFVIVSIVNAFNLIDGIDGLASGLAIVASFVFGSWFFVAGYLQQSIVAFALAGSLCAFFLYNVFGNTNKIFMGDTGSLVVGMILAVLVIRFNEFNVGNPAPYAVNASPAVSFAIVMLPLIDMLRVMTIRILSGKSPFYPDKNHIHHRLLEFFPTHLTVTLIMVASNATIIGLALLLNHYFTNVTLQFAGIFVFSLFLSFIPSRLLIWKKAGQTFAEKEKPVINGSIRLKPFASFGMKRKKSVQTNV